MTNPPPRGRRFTFHACVGRGGFGQVYRATMHRGRQEEIVAVKVLHVDAAADSQPIQRLRDEAAMLARLDHPGILDVHDLVVLEGDLALVAEYLPGADLDQVVRQDAFSCRSAVEVAIKVLEALHHVHEAPVGPGGRPLRLVHRDIKPANLRMGIDGAIKLLDFGMARADMVRSARTNPDSAFGSYPYMAPEQFAEDTSPPTHAIDIYGVGATLFEILTGERLWNVPLSRVYGNAMDGERHDRMLRERLASVEPASLRAVLASMTSHSADRPTARVLAEQLHDLLPTLPGVPFVEMLPTLRWPPERSLAGDYNGRTVEEDFIDVSSVGEGQGVRAPRPDTGPTVLFGNDGLAPRAPDAPPPPPAARSLPASPPDVTSASSPASDSRPPQPPDPSTVEWLQQHKFGTVGFLVAGMVLLPILVVVSMLAFGVLLRLTG